MPPRIGPQAVQLFAGLADLFYPDAGQSPPRRHGDAPPDVPEDAEPLEDADSRPAGNDSLRSQREYQRCERRQWPEANLARGGSPLLVGEADYRSHPRVFPAGVEGVREGGMQSAAPVRGGRHDIPTDHDPAFGSRDPAAAGNARAVKDRPVLRVHRDSDVLHGAGPGKEVPAIGF